MILYHVPHNNIHRLERGRRQYWPNHDISLCLSFMCMCALFTVMSVLRLLREVDSASNFPTSGIRAMVTRSMVVKILFSMAEHVIAVEDRMVIKEIKEGKKKN